ncbi:MAG: VWA domain-containing protein [Kofleriaceae bacterium]
MRALLVLFVSVGCERAREPPPPPPPKPPPVEAVDIVLAIDLSKSMEETDLPSDRLDATQVALRTFVANSPHDRFGIVLYAQQAKRLAPLTADRASIERALGKIQIGDVPDLGTAIGDGLGLAVDELATSTAKRRVVVLVGDGDNNWVTRFDPDQAAAAAKQAGVIVYTLLVGNDSTTDVGGMSTNPTTFKNIAATTSGAYYRATDPTTFARGLAAVRTKLDAGP